jgi:hypothetical protein
MSKHKLGICIPYRNRYEHLQKLVPRLTEHLNSKGIDHKFYVAHQVDEKLFNRGLMKNIAAKFAFDDGCDYIAWHDIDMLPLDGECDYSYPEKTPIHIATRLSKYDYKLGYEQYFGGVVLFTKEQVERTNGYSNDYWDWGQEDDDLFWRCYFEGYTNSNVYKEYKNKEVAIFNGTNSSIKIPWRKNINELFGSDHTICVLFKPEQQPDKYKDWLIGEEDKEFVEFPVFRKQSYCPYSISFNNSRAVTSMVYNSNKELVYNWIKRNESVWSWVTVSYNEKSGKLAFYLNDELAKSVDGGVKEERETVIPGGLLKYEDRSPIILGTNADPNNLINLKGEIAEVKIFDQYVEDHSQISAYHTSEIEPILHYDFTLDEDGKLRDLISGLEAKTLNVEFAIKDFDVEYVAIPHRIEGSFVCLPHKDEGLVDNKWAKGETTARNERRFVTQMQQRLIDYKNEGFNSMNYELISTKELDNNVLLINCKA